MNGGRISSEEKSALSAYIGLGILVILGAVVVYFFFLTKKETKNVTGFDPNRPVPSDAVLKKRLSAEEFSVVRQGATQTPYQNEFWDKWRPGIYVDVITGEPLFSSADKFDSGLGMPTFSKPISKDSLAESVDTSHNMQRTEVHSKRSNAHLGHVFPDEKSPTGQRYSINSAALNFVPVEQMKADGYEAYLPAVEAK